MLSDEHGVYVRRVGINAPTLTEFDYIVTLAIGPDLLIMTPVLSVTVILIHVTIAATIGYSLGLDLGCTLIRR